MVIPRGHINPCSWVVASGQTPGYIICNVQPETRATMILEQTESKQPDRASIATDNT